MKSGVLFESFFVGNPNVVSNSGISLTRLLVNTILNTFEWKEEDLRERFTGACVDGQYIHLNMRDHLADILNLPINLMDDSVIWDAAHRLELACQHAKEGYSIDGQRIGGTKWLIELDNVLQHIMKIFRFGHNHTDLRKIAAEYHQVFLEFNLFSETRFVEYAYRTYDHFVRMYAILSEKLNRDEQAALTEKEVADTTEKLQNMLVQIELVVDLLFMTDLSHLLTFTSKEFQRFDVFPFYAMTVYNNLKLQLNSARDSFNSFKVPQPINLHQTEHGKPYNVWQSFASGVKSITESQCFEKIGLLVRSERGRVTRSGTSFGCDCEGFSAIIMQRFKAYRIYLDLLITELINRFKPWPEWVILCYNSLDFQNSLEFAERKQSFQKLMEMPFGINPLLNDEKERLQAEYVTLHRNALTVIEKLRGDEAVKLEQVWYMLLTEKDYYNNCKFVNNYVLMFLNRSFNECIVESEVSSVEDISTSSRHLKDENVEKLNFISSNGPHPVVSMRLVDDMLTNHP